MSKPLSNLTKKDCIWNWGIKQQNAFEALKKAFTIAPVLRVPNDEDPFKLFTNTSDFATGAVLLQKDMQTNLWHPVAFFSKSLDVHERNYKIYDKKLLVVIWGLEEYRHHLEGHPHKIEIWSNHQNLTFFRTAQKLTRRQARWALFMTCFDFVLYHKRGKTMQAEDPLSRQTDHEMGIDLDNTNQVLLKPEFFAINALEATHESPINDEIILKEVKAALLSDKVTKDYKYKKAKLQARIKPTALCSAIDKENSIEFLLDSLYYLYNYYMVCALLSHAYHVIYHVTSCDVTLVI